jgi:alcohol dehydrogenase class IV
MHFEFATATRIIFGAGTVKELAPAAKSFGKRALVVTGTSGGRVSTIVEQLRSEGMAASEFYVSGEPTVAMVLSGLGQARTSDCEIVISIGGGSVIDAGKAIAALMTNTGDITDYLEVVGKGQALTNACATYIAIPTTAGTGSEVTRNAVLGVSEKRVKVSLRSPLMLARLAIIDPEMTYTSPPEITAASGLDALTQLIEPFLSNASNPMTDAICRDGMRRAARSLRCAYDNGEDASAREDMSLTALFGGMALANAKLGAAHGFAGPIGGMFPAPHGAICARLLPLVMEINLYAIRDRTGQLPVLERFAEVAQILTGDPNAHAEDGIRWLHELSSAFKIPSLATYGVKESDFPAIVAQAKKASSMKGNPIELNEQELTRIMELAL